MRAVASLDPDAAWNFFPTVTQKQAARQVQWHSCSERLQRVSKMMSLVDIRAVMNPRKKYLIEGDRSEGSNPPSSIQSLKRIERSMCYQLYSNFDGWAARPIFGGCRTCKHFLIRSPVCRARDSAVAASHKPPSVEQKEQEQYQGMP